MKRNEVLQIRIDPALQARLQQLRDERHVNVSTWLRGLITAELDREFPPPTSEALAAGDSYIATVLEVVERSDRHVLVRCTPPPGQGRLSRWTSRLSDAAPSWLRFRKETS